MASEIQMTEYGTMAILPVKFKTKRTEVLIEQKLAATLNRHSPGIVLNPMVKEYNPTAQDDEGNIVPCYEYSMTGEVDDS